MHCIFIVFSLWSAPYGDIRCIVNNHLTHTVMPCRKALWMASSAADWKDQKYENQRVTLEVAVASLFSQLAPGCSGLTSLALIVALYSSAEELRMSSAMDALELKSHVEGAMQNWTRSQARQNDGLDSSFTISVACYVRISLRINIQAATQAFLSKDFDAMREGLRRDGVLDVCPHAVHGLTAFLATEICVAPIAFLFGKHSITFAGHIFRAKLPLQLLYFASVNRCPKVTRRDPRYRPSCGILCARP